MHVSVPECKNPLHDRRVNTYNNDASKQNWATGVSVLLQVCLNIYTYTKTAEFMRSLAYVSAMQ